MKIKIRKTRNWKHATGLYEKGNGFCFLNRKSFAYDIGNRDVINIKADFNQEFVIGEEDECKFSLMVNTYLL